MNNKLIVCRPSVRNGAKIHRALKRLAKKKNISVNKYLELLIIKNIEREEK